MKKLLRWMLYFAGGILTLLLVGPFLIPIPPLEDTLPPEKLADPDSQFVEVNKVKVHFKTSGKGDPSILLLHGFAASLFSWREVMEPLAEYGQVIAFDRPAFGLTERPLQWEGLNPYGPDAQVELTVGLMDKLGINKAILIGNSAGGSVAVQTALRYPGRVAALVLLDPAIDIDDGNPAWLRLLFTTPQARRLGPLFVRSIRDWGLDFARTAWHDPSKITPDIWAGYTKPLQAQNWDRGLWEVNLAGYPPRFEDQLATLQPPVLIITGDDDRIVPTRHTIQLAEKFQNAELVVISNCGHAPQEECPQEFMHAVNQFLDH
jgi:pimeloyl-ACP methyl ester carboxylesterase